MTWEERAEDPWVPQVFLKSVKLFKCIDLSEAPLGLVFLSHGAPRVPFSCSCSWITSKLQTEP